MAAAEHVALAVAIVVLLLSPCRLTFCKTAAFMCLRYSAARLPTHPADPQVVVANVGDSRAVLSRGGRALDLSAEHRVWGKTPAVQVRCQHEPAPLRCLSLTLMPCKTGRNGHSAGVARPTARMCIACMVPCIACIGAIACNAPSASKATSATAASRRLRLPASSRWAAGWTTAASAACWQLAGAAHRS